MKKLLSLLLAVIMVVSLLPTAAFAEVYVDGESKGLLKEALVDNAQYVSADAAGDDLTVTGNVTGDGTHNSVYAEGGGEINIRGTVTGNISLGGDAIYAKDDSTKVVVVGTVTEKAGGSAINASSGAAVEAGSVDEKNDGDAINAQSGATVTVEKYVKEDDAGNAVSAHEGANVTVKEYVSEHEGGDAIYATKGATVTVENYVNEDYAGNAVSAHEGANVTVKGNVNEKGEGNAIKATGAETMVTVEGKVTESGDGSAINVQGATVIIVGNVEEANAGSAITATNGANVIVGGNVTEVVETAGASDGVISGFGATVIVEGLVNGRLKTNGTEDEKSGTIYIGALNGEIHDSDFNKIHYLIGTAANSAKLSDVTLVSDIVADGTIDGVNEKGYKYTTTADTTALNGKTITLKPADGKILTVSGFNGANVTYVANDDGSVTFTIGDSFTGGLQNLVLTVTDKQVPEEPEPEHKSYTTVTIGDRDDKEETKAEEVKEEENPDTGAPVMNLGAVAVVLGAAFVLSKKH